MALASDMFRGNTETIILNILRHGDSYGYEITKAINESSNNNCDIKEATIYTAFRRMEQDGLITTYWGDGVGGARRRYYAITPEGNDAYKTKADDWRLAKQILTKLIEGGDND